MTQLFLQMNAYDIETRITDEGRPALAPLLRVHELRTSGTLPVEGGLIVTSALVDHPPVVPAFAYRLDGRDRSIVISGDTRPSEALVKLARGADVLVHSVMFPSAVERRVARVPNASGLRASILAHQTSVEDAGRICARRRSQDARPLPPGSPGRPDGDRPDVARCRQNSLRGRGDRRTRFARGPGGRRGIGPGLR